MRFRGSVLRVFGLRDRDFKRILASSNASRPLDVAAEVGEMAEDSDRAIAPVPSGGSEWTASLDYP
jgi:hypothetical protein